MKTIKLIFALIFLLNLYGCKDTKRNQNHSERYLKNKLQKERVSPESQGMDSKALSELIEFVKKEKINANSVVILRNGVPILDAHFYPNNKEYLHDIASITKSIASLLTGIAIDEGFIRNEHQKIIDFFPEHKHLFDSDEKKSITIQHILTMTSGICSNSRQGEQQRDEMRTSKNPVEFLLSNQLSSETGKEFTYCSPSVQLISIIIATTTGKSMEQFAKTKLFDPLEISDFIIGKDANGYSNASGDFFLKANDLAKIGQLILDSGKYQNKQVVSKEWLEKSLTKWMPLDNEESYGFLWWLRNDLGGLIEAQGRGGQRLIILPKERLVVVMLGNGFEPSDIGKFIVKSIKSDEPIAENITAFHNLNNGLKSIQEEFNILEVKPIPEIARIIAGRKYRFEHNDLGFEYFSLDAFDKNDGMMNIGLNIKTTMEFGERNVPIGLNGEYQVSNQTRYKTPMAARAVWISESVIKIDYNEFSNIHKYQIEVKFFNNQAIWKMWDEADYNTTTSLTAYWNQNDE